MRVRAPRRTPGQIRGVLSYSGHLSNPPVPESVGNVHPATAAAIYAVAAGAHAHPQPLPYYVPAPPKYSVVYDNGAGYDPGNTDSRSIGQYADTNTGIVHTTRGFSRRMIAQDVGQLLGYQALSAGDRVYFSRLLGTDPGYWTDLHANSPAGATKQAGNEAFANYYSVAATGGLKKGESLVLGNTSIDPDRLKAFTAALQRLGRRRNLKAYTPQ